MSNLSKKAADRILTLKEERDQVQEKLAEVQEELDELRRREKAEDIVLKARECDEAPERMKAASVDRFLALRAKMEEKEDQEFQKVAATVSMWDDEEGGIVPSEMPDSRDPDNFTEWIKSV